MELVPKQKVISKNSPKKEKNEKKPVTFNIKRCLETLVLRFGWFFKKKGVFRASTSVRLVGNSYCDIFGFFISTVQYWTISVPVPKGKKPPQKTRYCTN